MKKICRIRIDNNYKEMSIDLNFDNEKNNKLTIEELEKGGVRKAVYNILTPCYKSIESYIMDLVNIVDSVEILVSDEIYNNHVLNNITDNSNMEFIDNNKLHVFRITKQGYIKLIA